MSWTGILGGLLGLGGSIYSSQQNQASAQASMDFQKEVLQNRNQWATTDLKAAGLNPILAAGSTNSTAQGAQSTTENPGQAAVSSATAMQSLKIAQQQQRNQDAIAQSTVALNSARAEKEQAQANNLAAETGSGYYTALTSNLGSSSRHVEEKIGMMSYEKREIESRIAESSQRINHLRAQISKIGDERNELKARSNLHNANSGLSTVRGHESAAATGMYFVQARLAEEEQKIKHLQQQGMQIDNTLKQFTVPKARNLAEYENNFRKQLTTTPYSRYYWSGQKKNPYNEKRIKFKIPGIGSTD